MRKKNHDTLCSICHQDRNGARNTAQPINEGPCCDHCYLNTVMMARFTALMTRFNLLQYFTTDGRLTQEEEDHE